MDLEGNFLLEGRFFFVFLAFFFLIFFLFCFVFFGVGVFFFGWASIDFRVVDLVQSKSKFERVKSCKFLGVGLVGDCLPALLVTFWCRLPGLMTSVSSGNGSSFIIF